MSLPLWVVCVVWFCVLLVLGKWRGTLRGPQAGTRIASALVSICAGLVVTVAGVLLEIELCFGSGSECRGVEPIWSPGGAVLAYVGLGLCFALPAVALLWRGRSDE
jgi:hypothetical protein